MSNIVRIAPSNSLILVMDMSIGKIPASMDDSLISATSSCVAVGTLSELDGETTISVRDHVANVGLSLAFDGILDTPTKVLSVCTVKNTEVLAYRVPSTHTRIQIWVNHPSEPSEIEIVTL